MTNNITTRPRLLEPETISYPDGKPFLVRTERDEKIYYPYNHEKGISFPQIVSSLEDGKYNLVTTCFNENGQAIYTRNLDKGSATHGTWSYGAMPSPKNIFFLEKNFLFEFENKKLVRKSLVDPDNNTILRCEEFGRKKMPKNVHSSQHAILEAYKQLKDQMENIKKPDALLSVLLPD